MSQLKTKQEQKKLKRLQESQKESSKIEIEEILQNSDDGWVEIEHKRTNLDMKIKTPFNESQTKLTKKDRLTEEDKQKLQELDKQLNERLNFVLSKAQPQQQITKKTEPQCEQPTQTILLQDKSEPQIDLKVNPDNKSDGKPSFETSIKVFKHFEDQKQEKIIKEPVTKVNKGKLVEGELHQNNINEQNLNLKEKVQNFNGQIPQQQTLKVLKSGDKQNPYFSNQNACPENSSGIQMFGRLKRHNNLSFMTGRPYQSYDDRTFFKENSFSLKENYSSLNNNSKFQIKKQEGAQSSNLPYSINSGQVKKQEVYTPIIQNHIIKDPIQEQPMKKYEAIQIIVHNSIEQPIVNEEVQQQSSLIKQVNLNKEQTIQTQSLLTINSFPDLYDNQDLANSVGDVSQMDASLIQIESKRKLISDNIEVVIHTLDNGEQIISLETMLSIVDQSLDLMKDKYVSYIKQMRGVRRQLLFEEKDYQIYLQTILQMTQDVFNLLQEGYSTVCQALDIEDELFEHSYVLWAHDSDQNDEEDDNGSTNQFISRITFAQQELKENVKSRVNLLKNKGKEIVKYQLNLIKSHKAVDVFAEIMPFFLQSSDQQQLLPAVLSYVIEDLIYQKFSIEEEDKIKFLKTNRYDKELQQLLIELDEVAKEHFEINLQQG